jgi:16S rRNA C967 or C1407 C5-methylase (RsmB/RsmF family)
MKSAILSEVFAEICETQTHFDSLLSKIHPLQRGKVAVYLGAFLRRPLTLAKHFELELAESAEDFWQSSFIKLKKNPAIHELLKRIWESGGDFPNQGSEIDFPTELVNEWTQDWGIDVTKKMCMFLSQDPLTTIRLHRIAREDEEKLKKTFAAAEGFPKNRLGNYSILARVFKGFAPVQKIELFEKGWYEIQDEGSQVMSIYALESGLMKSALTPVPSVGPKSDMVFFNKTSLQNIAPRVVVDACSGAGGKALAIADLMRGQGRVFAYDIYEKKIQALRKRSERSPDRNVQGVLLKATEEARAEQLKEFYDSADRVLIDAPCAGYGVLRRNPDSKWNRKPLAAAEEKIDITELQQKVLKEYAPLTKVGGEMIYGVCTFSKRETLDQVEWIQKNLPNFELKSFGFIGPYDTDGFFMAAFERKK